MQKDTAKESLGGQTWQFKAAPRPREGKAWDSPILGPILAKAGEQDLPERWRKAALPRGPQKPRLLVLAHPPGAGVPWLCKRHGWWSRKRTGVTPFTWAITARGRSFGLGQQTTWVSTRGRWFWDQEILQRPSQRNALSSQPSTWSGKTFIAMTALYGMVPFVQHFKSGIVGGRVKGCFSSWRVFPSFFFCFQFVKNCTKIKNFHTRARSDQQPLKTWDDLRYGQLEPQNKKKTLKPKGFL